MSNPDSTGPQYSLPPKRSSRALDAGNLIILAVLLGVIAVQWPMLKGLFYRMSGTPAPEGVIAWRSNFASALAEAKRAGRPLLVDFSASWCPPCQLMKHEVWPDSEVGKLANDRYIPVYLDVDDNGAIAQRYGIDTIPAVLILDSEGHVLHQAGPMSRSELVEFLKAGLAG